MHRKVADEEDNHKGNHHQGSFFPFIFSGSGINAFDILICTDIGVEIKVLLTAATMTNHIVGS